MWRRFGVLAMALVVLAAGGWLLGPRPTGHANDAQPPLGLFTSLPILWSEQADLRDVLSASKRPHWARAVLERHGKVVALDTLLDFARLDRLIIAQPRPLSPDENVALDRWVRQGGRVLLFADPMLTQESAFALGDRRRPQDVALMSPILGRWGLELRFDEQQPDGLRENAGEALPVNLAGELALKAGGSDARCAIGAQALVARCKVGKGRAVIVADAALLDTEASAEAQADRLDALLGDAFRN